MILANFRSLLPKQDNLFCSIEACSADAVVGTETWLSKEVTDRELSISASFQIYRKDKNESRGGGVIIAVKSELTSSLVDIPSSLQILWVTARLNFKLCLIGLCYRPPDSSSHFVDKLTASLEQVNTKFPNSPVMLTGDFNLPGINWSTQKVDNC